MKGRILARLWFDLTCYEHEKVLGKRMGGGMITRW